MLPLLYITEGEPAYEKVRGDLSDWYKQAEEVFPNEKLLYDPLTCSISSHVGPNAFGMELNVKITI